jgi:hypothetical protein
MTGLPSLLGLADVAERPLRERKLADRKSALAELRSAWLVGNDRKTGLGRTGRKTGLVDFDA